MRNAHTRRASVSRAPIAVEGPVSQCLGLPGGHLEAGENSRQALVRELREELGVEITPPVGNPLLTRQSAELFQEIWRVEAWEGEIFNAAPDEHDALGWFSLDKAISLDLADDGYRALFNQVLN